MIGRVVHGEALALLSSMEAASVHAVVSDPPAGIAFMGATWDDPGTYGFADGADRVGSPPTVNLNRNPTCQTCGGRKRAGTHTKACTCDKPAWNESALRHRDRDAFISQMRPIFGECLRVLKPGGWALIWALPRTSHWTATAMEEAGFEIRDVITHLFGQGFPKSLDVSKAIDKAAGAERKVIGTQRMTGSAAVPISQKGGTFVTGAGTAPAIDVPITEAATEDAKRWAGWGTALKPASEHWILARAPMRGTVVANVLQHGTGALNIGATRIGTEGGGTHCTNRGPDGQCLGHQNAGQSTAGETFHAAESSGGRWPANVALSHAEGCELAGTSRVRTGTTYEPDAPRKHAVANSPGQCLGRTVGYADDDGREEVETWHCVEGCPVAELDRQSGITEDLPPSVLRRGATTGKGLGDQGAAPQEVQRPGYSGGGASRFFYCAKPSTSAKSENLDGKNTHPTVKSVDLMRWLVRLVTPKGGTVLDPFAGSGTTGVAAIMEGFDFIGIEREEKFFKLAQRRVTNALGPLFASAVGGAP